MGRKDDDEDLTSSTKEESKNDINELAKKCKPLNVQLNRVDVSSNGVVYVRDKESKSKMNDDCNKCDSTEEDPSEKVDNDDNNDTTEAETIKKIKEFIAMGRCEVESKKDVSTTKSNSVKPLKRKFSQPEEPSKVLKKNPSLENLTLELDLTLDDIAGSEKDSPEVKDSDVHKMSSNTDFCSSGSSKIKEKKDKEVKKQEIATPSRVSKRIQSKPVKFSVKKMLRGDDINVLKRIIPGYEREEGKKISVRQDLLKPAVKEEVPNDENEGIVMNNELAAVGESAANQCSVSDESSHENEVEEKEDVINSQEKLQSLIENKDNILSLSKSIEKLAVGNGKITVELKGTQQKKVVRIAVPPQQSKPPPNTSLGPDIIIKRVKPLKKTFTLSDKPKVLQESTPSPLNKSSIEEPELPSSSSTSNVVRITPRIFVQRISPKTKGDLLLLNKKNLFQRFKHDSRQMKTVRKSVRRRRRRRRTILKDLSDDDFIDDSDSSTIKTQEEEKENIVKTDVQSDNVKMSAPAESEPVPQPLETDPPPEQKITPVKEEKKKEGRPRGRPPKSVTLAQQAAKAKEIANKSPNIKSKKTDALVEKSLQTDNEGVYSEGKKKSFDNLFDNYFHTYERLVEHNDSLDSDSSDEFDDFYTHFARLNKSKVALDKEHTDHDLKDEQEITIYDLMNDMSLELPGWNIHIPSDGKGFCFAQIDIVDKVPHMKKAIEMDLEFNAKVYVNGTLRADYCGIYNTYEDIQQLIYDVDIL